MKTIYLVEEITNNKGVFNIDSIAFATKELAENKLCKCINDYKDLFKHERIMKYSAQFWDAKDMYISIEIRELIVNE